MRGASGASVDVTVHGRIAVDDQFSAVAAAVAGGGLVVLPVQTVTHDPSARTLRRVLADWIVPGESAQIVYAASRHVPLRVSMFCDALIAHSSSCAGPPSETRAGPEARERLLDDSA